MPGLDKFVPNFENKAQDFLRDSPVLTFERGKRRCALCGGQEANWLIEDPIPESCMDGSKT